MFAFLKQLFVSVLVAVGLVATPTPGTPSPTVAVVEPWVTAEPSFTSESAPTVTPTPSATADPNQAASSALPATSSTSPTPTPNSMPASTPSSAPTSAPTPTPIPGAHWCNGRYWEPCSADTVFQCMPDGGHCEYPSGINPQNPWGAYGSQENYELAVRLRLLERQLAGGSSVAAPRPTPDMACLQPYIDYLQRTIDQRNVELRQYTDREKELDALYQQFLKEVEAAKHAPVANQLIQSRIYAVTTRYADCAAERADLARLKSRLMEYYAPYIESTKVEARAACGNISLEILTNYN